MEANLKQIFIKLNAIKVINVLHLAPYLFFTLDEVVFIHVKLQLYKNYGYIYILKDTYKKYKTNFIEISYRIIILLQCMSLSNKFCCCTRSPDSENHICMKNAFYQLWRMLVFLYYLLFTAITFLSVYYLYLA